MLSSNMKLLQLNIEGGKLLNEIAEYIKEHDYDIICMQEMTSDLRFQMSHKTHLNPDITEFPSLDCFEELSRRLERWTGILSKTFTDPNGKNYFGNAIFFKKELQHLSTNQIPMTEERIVEIDNFDPPSYPMRAFTVELETPEGTLQIVNGHFTWGPTPYDTHTTVYRAQIVRDYLLKIKKPFILTGDFNVDSRSVTCMQFETISRNIVRDLKISNTLNPGRHKAPHLFPEGIACDQIFVSPEIDVFGFKVIKKDLSDHYGLEIEFEFKSLDSKPVGGP
jgi:endonuclease/exonuclease/phosphatase family metal-dependent hydrolase